VATGYRKKMFSYSGLWNNLNQQKKLFVIFVVLCILPINAIGMVSFRLSTQVLEKKIVEDFNVIASQFNLALENYLKDFDRFSTLPYFNPSIIQILERPYNANTNPSYQQLQGRHAIFDAMLAYPFINQSIESMVIYGLNGSIYGYHKDQFGTNIDMAYRPDQEEWYQKVLAVKGKVVITGVRRQQQFLNQRSPVITVARLLYNKNLVPIGVVAIDVSPKFIDKLVKTLALPNIQVTVTDDHSDVVYASNSKWSQVLFDYTTELPAYENTFVHNVNLPVKNGKDALIGVMNTNEYSKWSTFFLMERSALFKESAMIRNLTIGITVILTFLFICISWLLAKVMSRPMEELMRWMKKLQMGSFDLPNAMARQDEIGKLYINFGNMVMSLKEMMHSIEEKEKKKRQAELYALRSRINPHFLYNTLNSIRMLAIIQQSSVIANMIQSLNALLKVNMKMEKELITVREELFILDHYVQIMKLRYTNQFEFVIRIDDRFMDFLVPPLILQPLVENSIFHGLSKAGMIVYIEAEECSNGNDFLLLVKDNGSGIDPDILAGLQLSLESNSTSDRIGISNVNERIKLRYGHAYGLYIDSILNKGTTVSVKLLQCKQMEG
jgi:two-component system sensor histidine kinase YesM